MGPSGAKLDVTSMVDILKIYLGALLISNLDLQRLF